MPRRPSSYKIAGPLSPSGDRITPDASAFLAILDKTISGEEGAIVPNGLESARLHIAKFAPALEKDIRFQRLLTAAASRDARFVTFVTSRNREASK